MNDEHQNYVKLLILTPPLCDTNEAVTVPKPENLAAEVVQHNHKKIAATLSCRLKGSSGAAIADAEFTIALYVEARSAEVLTYRGRLGYEKFWEEE